MSHLSRGSAAGTSFGTTDEGCHTVGAMWSPGRLGVAAVSGAMALTALLASCIAFGGDTFDISPALSYLTEARQLRAKAWAWSHAVSPMSLARQLRAPGKKKRKHMQQSDSDYYDDHGYPTEAPDPDYYVDRTSDGVDVVYDDDDATDAIDYEDDNADYYADDDDIEVPIPPELELGLQQAFLQLLNVAFTVASIIFACVYKSRVVDMKPRLDPTASSGTSTTVLSKHGLFDCCGDANICLHAWFCFKVRVADTYASANIMGFWMTFWLALCCPMAFIFCIMPMKRGQLRGRLGGSDNCTCGDFCKAVFCPCCTVVQDARAVDDALGVQTRCCCTLDKKEDRQPLVVGGPVAVLAQEQQAFHTGVPLQTPVLPWQGASPVMAVAAQPAVATPTQMMVVQGIPVAESAAGSVALQFQGRQAQHVNREPQDQEMQPM